MNPTQMKQEPQSLSQHQGSKQNKNHISRSSWDFHISLAYRLRFAIMGKQNIQSKRRYLPIAKVDMKKQAWESSSTFTYSWNSGFIKYGIGLWKSNKRFLKEIYSGKFCIKGYKKVISLFGSDIIQSDLWQTLKEI